MMRFPILFGAALALFACGSPLSAASANFDFAGGNRVPALTDVTSGVAVSNFAVHNLTHTGANGVIQIQASDVAGNSGAGISSGQYLSFDVTIPSGVSVSFTSLAVTFETTYTGSDYSNARVFSSIDSYDSAAADTIGIVGKEANNPTGLATDTLNLSTFAGNSGKGTNILAGSLSNLTNRTVTFYLPWIDGLSGTTPYTNVNSLRIDFDIGVATPVLPLAIESFTLPENRQASITFRGPQAGPYSLMASEDLAGPLYRKRWSQLTTGTFGSSTVSFTDTGTAGLAKRFYVLTGTTQPVARIMPVGDSITEGAPTFTIYRPGLFDKLTTAGYHFQFVGSRSSTYASPVTGTTVTLRHEGIGGTDAELAATNMASRLAANPADILLIHSGHNHDAAENGGAGPIAGIVNAHRSMITTARAANPKMIILMCKVITAGKLPKYSYIPDLNIQLGALAAELNTPASPVIIVDQADGFVWQTDTISDLVHPNENGAAKMATKWFVALQPLLE